MKATRLFYIFFLVIACSTSNKRVDLDKVFRYNESKGVTSLDPAYARNLSLIWPVNQLYNGLVQLTDSLTVEPCIAKSWEISADGLQYTFYLRSDVFFHDDKSFKNSIGRKVVASDFVYTFNRLMDSKTASPGAWVLSVLNKDFIGSTNGCSALSEDRKSVV